MDPQVLYPIQDEEDQFAMSFDMPLVTDEEEEEENVIIFDLDEEVKDMDVNDISK